MKAFQGVLMELLGRFELPTSSLPRKCSAYWAITACWRPGTGSNRRPLAWQASVLTSWTTGPYVSFAWQLHHYSRYVRVCQVLFLIFRHYFLLFLFFLIFSCFFLCKSGYAVLVVSPPSWEMKGLDKWNHSCYNDEAVTRGSQKKPKQSTAPASQAIIWPGSSAG